MSPAWLGAGAPQIAILIFSYIKPFVNIDRKLVIPNRGLERERSRRRSASGQAVKPSRCRHPPAIPKYGLTLASLATCIHAPTLSRFTTKLFVHGILVSRLYPAGKMSTSIPGDLREVKVNETQTYFRQICVQNGFQ